MYIKMSDFFMGMGKQFTIEVLDIAEKLFQNEGEVLFHEGNPAQHFFCFAQRQGETEPG